MTVCWLQDSFKAFGSTTTDFLILSGISLNTMNVKNFDRVCSRIRLPEADCKIACRLLASLSAEQRERERERKENERHKRQLHR